MDPTPEDEAGVSEETAPSEVGAEFSRLVNARFYASAGLQDEAERVTGELSGLLSLVYHFGYTQACRDLGVDNETALAALQRAG